MADTVVENGVADGPSKFLDQIGKIDILSLQLLRP